SYLLILAQAYNVKHRSLVATRFRRGEWTRILTIEEISPRGYNLSACQSSKSPNCQNRTAFSRRKRDSGHPFAACFIATSKRSRRSAALILQSKWANSLPFLVPTGRARQRPSNCSP